MLLNDFLRIHQLDTTCNKREKIDASATLNFPCIESTDMQSNLLVTHKKKICLIARRYGARSISVFGSFAKGLENVHSDIDFLVELEPERSLLDLISMKYEIEDLTGRKVDVVTSAGISPYLSEQITKEAVPL